MGGCNDCYFFDVCTSRNRCSDYFPLTEKDDYKDIDETIENNRITFYNEWIKYISYED